jgi:hypothetical protein
MCIVNFSIISLKTYNIFGIVNCIKVYIENIFILFFGNVFSFMKINLIQTITFFKVLRI